MEVQDEAMASLPHSRTASRTSGRSPLPSGMTLNRPMSSVSGGTVGLNSLSRPGRDYSCPPPARSAFSSRRSSSGIFISSMFGSRFRHLQKLHSDAFVLGLNAVCIPGLPGGTLFRTSLPATPVSTPLRRDVFAHFSEQALRERLCQTPSPRKGPGRAFTPLDVEPCLILQEEDVSERIDSRSPEQDMDLDVTPPAPSSPCERT